MAYQIDFTASNYVNRARRKACLRLALLAALVGAVWGVHDVYVTYNEPTLNMRLSEYEAVSRPIEEMNAAWDTAGREYAALLRYYRLVWAANPTNFLAAMASPDAPRLARGSRPLSWTLTTGGDCRLDFHYAFAAGGKAEQAKGLEQEIASTVTSLVAVVGGKVDVQGVRHENLLNVNGLDLSVRFALPDVKTFPAKEKTLADCVAEIARMRETVQKVKLAGGGVKGAPSSTSDVLMKYLPSTFGKDRETGKVKADFPVCRDAIDVAGWFSKADQFIARNRIPGDAAERQQLKAAWNEIGEARFPWDRYRALDNPALVQRTKALGAVSDGVKRFKTFLEKRQADCRRKLEPFVEAYARSDVFNRPIVETDLRDRVAHAVGIEQARVTFRDESGAEPAILVKDDEKFTIAWVRWTLALGQAIGRDGERQRAPGEAGEPSPITRETLLACICRALALGPGYALEKVRVEFGADETVAGAVLEGLLPVKKVEAAAANP